MVPRQLFDRAAPDAVAATVANVADDRAVRKEHESRAGRTHALELETALPLRIDLAVDLFEAPPQGQRRGIFGALLVDLRNAVGGNGASQLARGMGTHAVGHYEQPAAIAELLRARRQHGLGVLIARAAATDVGAVAIDQARDFSHASTCLGRVA